MAAANIPDKFKNMYLPSAMMHAWQTRGLEVIEIDGKERSRYEHLIGELPKFIKYMQPWGATGTRRCYMRAMGSIVGSTSCAVARQGSAGQQGIPIQDSARSEPVATAK